jgi:hypothetical protein
LFSLLVKISALFLYFNAYSQPEKLTGVLTFEYQPKQIFQSNFSGTVINLPKLGSNFSKTHENVHQSIAQIKSLEVWEEQKQIENDIILMNKVLSAHNLQTFYTQRITDPWKREQIWKTPKMKRYVKNYLIAQSSADIISNLKAINNFEGINIPLASPSMPCR